MAAQGAANAHRAHVTIQAALAFKHSALVARYGLGDKVFHLVRDGSVASICGLPRDALGPASEDTELVCETWAVESSKPDRRVHPLPPPDDVGILRRAARPTEDEVQVGASGPRTGDCAGHRAAWPSSHPRHVAPRSGGRRQDCERSARPRQRSDHSRAVWPRNFENAEQCSSPLRIVARGRSRRNSHRSVRELKGAVSVFKSRSLVSLRQSDPTASYLHDSVRAEPPSNPGQFTALVWQDPSDWQSRLAVNSVYCGGHFGAVPRGASRYG